MNTNLRLAAVAVLALVLPLQAQLANVKVVTDANPDYSDMESMVRSITGRWETDQQKMWALFYWDHIARRQTTPMSVHGQELTDPIRQFNDYGFTMCSTISGIKMSTWNYMGYPAKFYDIGLHTVPEVWYEGRYHHYDNSLSVMYTLCDGKTIAGIQDVGKTLACEASGGKEEPGHIAIYHALNGTGPDGYLEGADTMRDLRHLGRDCFAPAILKYRWYYDNQDRGHRYILNLRDGEVYARHYTRLDKDGPGATVLDTTNPDFKADPAYYIHGGPNDTTKLPFDWEGANARYRIRGNGVRTWKPILDDAHLAGTLYSSKNIKALASGGLQSTSNEPAEAIFKVEGANVITSLKINAELDGAVALAFSTNNGKDWKDLKLEGAKADLKLIDEVNGEYEVLVKATLPAGATLKAISFDTITQVNAKTQPQLRLGKNSVYVGTGEQTGSIVAWPELQAGRYKAWAVQEQNLASAKDHPGYQGAIFQKEAAKEAFVVFKVDAPTDVTSVTYGGRFYNRAAKSRIDMAHSFDGGKTWQKTYSLTDTKAPWDVIRYETVGTVPAGTKSVLFRYAMSGPGSATDSCSIYSVRMEVNHKLAAASAGPVEVTFDWSERQKDYSLKQRSHTQIVDKLPATYEVNVGGYDQPVVNSLTVNLKGARGEVKPGYSDGKDAGGEKFVGAWATFGKNLAQGKPYTVSVPSGDNWGAGDPEGKKLTDGRVGSSYAGGTAYVEGLIWPANQKPEIIVDLGATQKIAAFRMHVHGYDFWDPMQGQVKDQAEVLTSTDNKQWTSHGNFDFNLYWKDIPVNYMWTDQETFHGHNFTKALPAAVDARYVKFALKPARMMDVTEVQALDGVKFEPFDLKIALPDPAANGKSPPNATISPNARQWRQGERPTDIGVPPR